jgi:hypothetical protein
MRVWWIAMVVACRGSHALPPDAAVDAPADAASSCTIIAMSADPCLGPTPACDPALSCADRDGDGLADAWEQAGGIDLDGDGIVDTCHDLVLSDADVAAPDIYLQYDWIDYGAGSTPCETTADCTAAGGAHAGETCTGPQRSPSASHSCEFACSSDADCTGRNDPASRIGDRCHANVCEHTHDPEVVAPDAIDEVVAAFAVHGTHLHVLRGHGFAHSTVVSMRRPDQLTTACEGGSLGTSSAGIGAYAVSMYELKASSFVDQHLLAYHYVVFGHYSGCDSAAHCGACPAATNPDTTAKSAPVAGQSGLAELLGNDLLVSLGNRIQDIGFGPNVMNVGTTFMHELGHNLGLHHGGGIGEVGPATDETNWKPNYVSVMNYRYQFTGIVAAKAADDPTPIPCTTSAQCPAPNRCLISMCARLDYSDEALPASGSHVLDEQHLDETVGLGSTSDPDVISFTDSQCDLPASRATTVGPVDWNGDTLPTATDVQADLASGVDHACDPNNLSSLRGYADWAPHAPGAFRYAFQCTSFAGD